MKFLMDWRNNPSGETSQGPDKEVRQRDEQTALAASNGVVREELWNIWEHSKYHGTLNEGGQNHS